MNPVKRTALIVASALFIFLIFLVFIIFFIDQHRSRKAFLKMCKKNGITFSPGKDRKVVYRRDGLALMLPDNTPDAFVEYHPLFAEEFGTDFSGKKIYIQTEAGEYFTYSCEKMSLTINSFAWQMFTWQNAHDDTNGMMAYLPLNTHYVRVNSSYPAAAGPDVPMALFQSLLGCVMSVDADE